MLIVTSMYVLVAVTAIGARRWQWFETAQAPLVQIVEEITGSNLAVLLFAVAAVLAIFSVVITVLYGQSRILLTMSRDGMVPKIFGLVSRRTGTPLAGTLIIGGLVAITAALIPLGELADATSIGTLFAFFLVNLAVIYLRFKRPDLERSFRVPFGPVVPALGALACAFLMINLGGNHLGGLRRVDGRRRSRLLRLQPPPLGRRRTQRVRLPHQRRRLSRPPVPRIPRRTYAAAALSPRVRRQGR
jgi:APA family basic amino acid/polyamine antiporter